MDDRSAALTNGIVAAVPAWVQRCVTTVMSAYSGEVPEVVASEAAEAGQYARESVSQQLHLLMESDIDEQRTTPLSVLRSAVAYPTAVLSRAGVPPVHRDQFAEKVFPEDVYGLSPASLGELDPQLVDLGIAWGAAKAMAHKRRHGGAS